MLYVSFWTIALSNLPGGMFSKRALSDEQAGQLIATARQDEKLTGVSAVDLFAPHAQRNRELHAEVCQALGRRGIELSIKDFSSGEYCYPIPLARVGQGSRMLVVDCGFELNPEHRGRRLALKERTIERPPELLQVCADTLRCYLFEGVPP